jgi:hypothetical protein
MFHDGNSKIPATNTPEFWAMFANAEKQLMAQFPSPPTDPASLAIYNDLTKPLFEYGGKPISLNTLCNEDSATAITDLANDFQQIAPTLTDLQNNIDTWYNTYYPGSSGEPPSTMPPGLDTEFSKLQTDLANKDMTSVMADIMALYNTLTAPGTTLDGYGQMLLNYLTAGITPDGQTSLYSLAKAGDSSDLSEWLYNPPSLGPPFAQPTGMASNLLSGGWIASILKDWEFPHK